MKRMKRLVAFLVALATMASMCAFSMTAFAEDAALPSVTVSDEDILRIEKLEALGVIDASYDPTTYVTRRKMADIIVKYMNVTPSANTNGTPFRDVAMKDASFASICTLYNMGIVTGDDELRFNPDAYVTYDQALVFLVNAIGHKMFAEREGGYPTGYHRVAIKHGMLKGISMKQGTDPVSFPDLYKMLEAALDAATVVPQYYGDGSVTYTLSDTDTYLYEKYGIRKYHGIVTGNENTKLTSGDSYLTDEQIEIDGQLYDTPGYVYDYFLGFTVDYYVKVNSITDAEMVYIEEARNYNDVTKIDAEDILADKTTSDRIYYTDKDNEEKEYHITFDANYDVIYNKQCWTGYGSLANVVPATGYVEALDNNNDGKIDVLFVYEYKNYVVASTDSYMEQVISESGTVLDFDTSKHEIKFYFTGETKKRNFNSVTVGSVISVLESKGTEKVITVYISSEEIIGKIAGSQSDLGFQIGEQWYEAAYNYVADGYVALVPGLEGAFKLDMNGEIAAYSKDASAKEGEMIGIVTGMEYESSAIYKSIDLKIFAHTGEFLMAPVAERVMINDVRYDLSDDTGFANAKNKLDATADVYLIRFMLNNNGEVNTIYTTKSRDADGTIDVLVENRADYMTSRAGRMFMYKDGDGNGCISRLSENHYTVMTIPGAANRAEDNKYSVYKDTIKGDRWWGKRSGAVINSETYSLYSFGLSDVTMINVMVFRLADQPVGGGVLEKSPTLNDKFGMVTDFSIGLNEDEEQVPVIQFDGGDAVKMAKEVTYYDAAHTSGAICNSEDLITGNNSVPKLENGTIVMYRVNTEGEIVSVKFITDGDGNKLITFPGGGGNIYGSGGLGNDADSSDYNIVTGEIVNVDPKEKLVQIKVGQSENNVIIIGGSIYMYYTGTEKLVSGKSTDLTVGDKFVVLLTDYLTISKMYIFK